MLDAVIAMTNSGAEHRRRSIVSVAGGGAAETAEVLALGRAVGAAVARAGAHLVCGGLGGVMEAVAMGFREALGEGLVVGVLPGEDRRAANPYVDVALATGLGRGRNAVVALSGDGLIAVGGGGGTISEMGLALQAGRPVAALAVSGGAAERLAGFAVGPSETSDAGATVYAARDPEDAVRYVLSRGSPGAPA